MTQNVFTYGSLMFAQVWQRVVAARYRSSPAALAGYRRFALVDDTYPGMIEAATGAHAGNVTGVLYFDVNDADLRALDDFEGSDYERRTVQVMAPAAGLLTAQTYVFLLPGRLAAHDWDPAAFRLERFLGTYCRDRPDDAVQPVPDQPV